MYSCKMLNPALRLVVLYRLSLLWNATTSSPNADWPELVCSSPVRDHLGWRLTNKRSVMKLCRASDTAKTSQKLRTSDSSRSNHPCGESLAIFLWTGSNIKYFACTHARFLLLHALHRVGPDHVSRRTRPSPRLTYTCVNNNFVRGGEGPGMSLP